MSKPGLVTRLIHRDYARSLDDKPVPENGRVAQAMLSIHLTSIEIRTGAMPVKWVRLSDFVNLKEIS